MLRQNQVVFYEDKQQQEVDADSYFQMQFSQKIVHKESMINYIYQLLDHILCQDQVIQELYISIEEREIKIN
jgi:hypothetical protein